jgi:hypothetical protein
VRHAHLKSRVVPATISLILSVLLMIAIVSQVRFRWREPEITPTAQAEHSTTGKAAREAGARLSPTDQKLSIEPKPVGPKPVQPADHPAPGSRVHTGNGLATIIARN